MADMHRLKLMLAMLIAPLTALCCSGVFGCASTAKPSAQRLLPQPGQVIRIVSPRNLSGRPLHEVESRLWFGDSIAAQAGIPGKPINLMQGFGIALELVLRDSGWNVTRGDDATLQLHPALTAWETGDVNHEGTIEAAAACVLVEAGTERAQGESKRTFGLLEVMNLDTEHSRVDPTRRDIPGRVEQILITLARNCLADAGLIPDPRK